MNSNMNTNYSNIKQEIAEMTMQAPRRKFHVKSVDKYLAENYSKTECFYAGEPTSPFASLSPVNSLDTTPRRSIDSQLTEPELANCEDDEAYDQFVQNQLQQWFLENEKAQRPPSPPLKRASVAHNPVKKLNLPSTIIEEEEAESCHSDNELDINESDKKSKSFYTVENLLIIREEDEEMEVINDTEGLNMIPDVKQIAYTTNKSENLHNIHDETHDTQMEESNGSHKQIAFPQLHGRIIEDYMHESENLNSSHLKNNTEVNESKSCVNFVLHSDDIATQYIKENDRECTREEDAQVNADIGGKKKIKNKWYRKLLRKFNLKKKISKLLHRN